MQDKRHALRVNVSTRSEARADNIAVPDGALNVHRHKDKIATSGRGVSRRLTAAEGGGHPRADHDSSIRPRQAAAGPVAPAASRVRVSVRTRPRPIYRPSGGGRSGAGRTAALAALAVLAALALLLPARLAWRAAHAPAAPAPAPAAHSAAPAAAPGATPRLPEAAGAVRPAPPAVTPERADEPPVRVYLSRTGGVETVPLEQYVTGVLAAEMPAGFELEALKAQAIAARTFIVRRLAAGDTSGTPNRRADVNDTVSHQAYISRAQLGKWPDHGKAEALAKLQQAVKQTEGLVLVYQGKPITASFFSSSGGYTENSEEYWSVKIPYLRSVPSPWEATINPSNRQTVDIPLVRVLRKLGQQASKTSESALASGSSSHKPAGTAQTRRGDKPIQVLSLTTGRKVKEIRIGGQTYTGREVREKLGLRSAQFTMALDGEDVKITTYGYGHGIGMSQWGANGMAKEGFTATQILKHYYTGVSFQQASHIIK